MEVVSIYRNTFRENERQKAGSDGRTHWWTVIARDGEFIEHRHFNGKVDEDGTDHAELEAQRAAAMISDGNA